MKYINKIILINIIFIDYFIEFDISDIRLIYKEVTIYYLHHPYMWYWVGNVHKGAE